MMSAPAGITLRFLSGPRDGETVTCGLSDSGELVLGRAPGSGVLLSDDPDVSRRHARLAWRDGAWFLEDLSSRNGTFVGEFAASRSVAGAIRLEPSAIFRVGNTRFRLLGDTSAIAGVTAKAAVAPEA